MYSLRFCILGRAHTPRDANEYCTESTFFGRHSCRTIMLNLCKVVNRKMPAGFGDYIRDLCVLRASKGSVVRA